MLHLVYGMNCPSKLASLDKHSFTFITQQFIIFTPSLSFSLTPSVFHSERKAWLFDTYFPRDTLFFIPLSLHRNSRSLLLSGNKRTS